MQESGAHGRSGGSSLNVGVIMYQTSTSKGQELVAQRMTRELETQGHRAVLITSRYHDFRPVVSAREVRRSGGYVRYRDDQLGVSVCRVESRRVEWPPRRVEFSNYISILDQIVKELRLNVLIAHSTLWNGPDLTALFVLWKKRMGSRLVFCHMSHFQPPASRRYSLLERELRRAWNEYTLSRIIREADLLLVTTPAAERDMVEHGASRDKCLLFPGGISVAPRLSRRALAEFRHDHGIPAGDRLVTFLGTVERRKNVGAIVRVAELMRRNRDVRFVIAGRLEGPYAEKLMKESQSLPNFTALGEISEEDKWKLIRSSYLNLSMSELEALGIAQLEFMGAGVPVVTSGVGGQGWVVRNGHTGLVLRGPNDIKGAVSAIRRLLDHPDYQARLAKNAERFASNFTMKTLVKRLVGRVRENLRPRPVP